MDHYQTKTKEWIQQFVIGYNLCPFAAQPFHQDLIKYVVLRSKKLEDLVVSTFEECIKLYESEATEIETTLIIHPNVLLDFNDYNEVVGQMQEDLEALNFDGVVQLASFHPAYQFDGTNADDPENFTNRSPYPMIHILRENSVEKAIALHPDIENIPAENIKTMQTIGIKDLTKKRNEIIGKN